MQNRLKLFGLSAVSMAVVLMMAPANAAESGRAAYNVRQLNRGGMSASQRMPVMPTIPINTTGNMTTDLPDTPITPSNPNTPDNPDNPDKPDVPDEPEPECPDGGVKNSEYTVDKCMRDVYACVNNGALPNGINDMFDEELRNSIINGMGLCTAQVERCVREVRRDCENIYHSAADVWIDFNTRRVQPEYYSFVLRKTGLTPRQAENTCWLLDKNTYGSSFDAVANSGTTTYEYNNRVGAYNGQGGVNIIKKNPQGAIVNNGNPGVDGGRGHYARWDPVRAECHIRIAAYNKDTPIKNSWLFGAVGDDRLAEAWGKAGSTFTCNKDLFGFSLYKNTNTVAVVGIGGGTLVGAGIGALAGHGDREFDCGNADHRKKLYNQLKGNFDIVNKYMNIKIPASSHELTQAQCNALVELYNKYKNVRSAVNLCKKRGGTALASADINADTKYVFRCTVTRNSNGRTSTNVQVSMTYDNGAVNISPDNVTLSEDQLKNCYKSTDIEGVIIKPAQYCMEDDNPIPLGDCADRIEEAIESMHDNIINGNLSAVGQINIGGKLYDKSCVFNPINLDASTSSGIYCGCSETGCATSTGCLPYEVMDIELQELDTYIAGLSIDGDKNNRVKTTLTGAAIGAGTGGLATAITAFVEKNNINCRLGDGLDQVGYGKSMSIGTLRDFYVKWNLRLPENVAPTSMVVDCNSWRRACAEITDLEQCKSAQVNYKPAGAPAITLIHAACIPSGSVCIENYPVAKSYGACLPQTTSDDDKTDGDQDNSGTTDSAKTE